MFDKDLFSNILKKINDEYSSMTEFAKKASLDRSYISKYINKRLTNPPTPKILAGIANASKGLTSYDELMKICGYINLSGLYDINLNTDELSILSEMLLDYKKFLRANHSSTKFNEQKYLKKLSDESKNKIIIAFRRNSLDLILGNQNDSSSTDNEFKFVTEDDAMFPLLDIGDIAIIFRQNKIDNILTKNKGTYLIKINNNTTIRKIVLNEDESYYSLIAMNACYKVINIPKNEFYNQIQILGKVIKAENNSAFK